MSVKLKKDSDFFQMLSKSVKEVENGIEIEGYASTKDKDRVKDVVEPTAFKSAINGYMENPIVLLQHDQTKPIGIVKEATIDNKGLYIKALITEDTDGVFSKLKNKVLRAFSIGYRIKDYEIEEEKDLDGSVRDYHQTIKDLELYEISLVSVPCNPYALSKSIDGCFEKDFSSNNEIMENENIETVEVKEENSETETVEEVKTEESVETTESNEAVSEESEVKEVEAQEEVEEVSENDSETESNNGAEPVETAEATETEEVVETKSMEIEKKEIDSQMKSFEMKFKEFDLMKKELDETRELLKGAIEVIAGLERDIKNIGINHYSYEQPLKKSNGYSSLISQLKN